MFKNLVQSVFKKLGFEVRRTFDSSSKMPVELTPEECDIIRHVFSHKLTLVSPERLWTTLMACKHAIEHKIEGDFVECGVWRGGNAMVAAEMFKLYGVSKKIWLFDTYKGMTAPTDVDVSIADGLAARNKYVSKKRGTHNEWCYASLDDVKNNFDQRDLLSENVVFVEGDVCQTLKDRRHVPTNICVLRLDTDWYESTKVELEVLYPRLTVGGSLIIDDYGHWSGAKKATDEYFAIHGNRPFLQYTDYTGRISVKVS